ncbi:MAG: peptidylprolyl isomerase [Wenzhouxiangellaceae bacterium]|nr:peptidylprolyl isomerase [Wenzhouxiangellaceae bacterium]
MNCKPLIILFLSSFFLACSPTSDDPLVSSEDTVMVEVDGEPLTLEMLEVQMEMRGIEEDDIDGMRQALEDMIRVVAVARRGDREAVSLRPRVRAERRLKDIEVRYLRYLEAFQADHPVSEEEIREVYDLQRERAGPYRYRLETIEFPGQGDALAMLDALTSGALDFRGALEQAGREQRIVRRTDWIDGSQVPPAFSDLLAATDPGRVLEQLLPYQDLWLIVRVAEREAFTPPPLDEVREGIRRTLQRERVQAMIDSTRSAVEVVPVLPLESAAEPAPGVAGPADADTDNAQTSSD